MIVRQRPELEVAALSGEVEAVMRGIVDRLMQLPYADGASLSTIDDHFAYFQVCAGADLPLQGRTFRLEETLGATCLVAGDLTVLRTSTGSELERCLTAGASSIVLAPLEWDGRVRGILGVRSTSLEAFDEAGVEQIRMLAAGASIALRNAEVIAVLAASERSYRELHDQAADAILVTDAAGRILDANEAAAALLWRPVAELRGLPAEELLAPSERAADPLRTDELLRTGELRSERPFVRKDGTEVMVEYSCRLLEDGRIHASLRDVTQRKRNEARLRTSLGRLHAIVQTQQEISSLELDHDALMATIVERAQRLCAGDGASVQWFEGHESVFRHCSGIAAGLVGLRLERSASLSGAAALADEAVYAADTETDARVHADACARMGARSVVCAPLHRDGRVEGVLAVVARNPNAFDELAIETARLMAEFVSAVMRNTTELEERRLLVEQLRTQHQLYEAMFWRSVVPKIVCDDERRIVDLNEAAQQLIGVAVGEAAGLTVDELLADEPVAALFPTFLAQGTFEAETWLHRPDGARRRIEFTATADVMPGRHIAVVRDLTRQRELETQLHQAQKMEAVGRLAGGIAHDFNNLLTAISGYSEFLIAGAAGDEKIRRHAEEIKKAAARAAALTGQLLAFSRRQVLQPRLLDLNATVGDMDMMLRRVIGEDVELVTLLDPELAAVRADPTQIEQVIVNLAVNARDAMPHGGSLTIETANVVGDGGALVELCLTDTGVGMTDAEREQLFDPFFTTKEGGTGLGLATVYGIVEQSGGTIEVDSAPGAGASFRILLPALAAPADPAPAEPAALDPGTGHETVLLVEDEAVVRQLVAEILGGNGYRVLQAGDGPSALELLRRHTGDVDLLVTDVVMPGMSGPEVAAAVTAMRPRAQVLYISGYTDSAIDHHGVLDSGIAFLQKPFSPDELARKVREVLDGAAACMPVD